MGTLSRVVEAPFELLASAVRTTAGADNGSAVNAPGGHVQAIVFTLDVTAAAAGGGDTLDVLIQTDLDGANWVDVVRFSEVVGGGGAKRFTEKIKAAVKEDGFEIGSALTVGTTRDLLGARYRVRWNLADAGGGVQSFTFGVTACPM
jgi:hypothetical protein